MKTAEIEREYGPSPGSTHLHGVTYDGHDVWSVAGDKLQAFDPGSGKPTKTVQCKERTRGLEFTLQSVRRASGFVTRTGFPSRKASAFSMLWR
jgi:hypothetical protein